MMTDFKWLVKQLLLVFFYIAFFCSAGCRQLQDLEVADVEVDPCGDGQSAAEGAVLGLFEYDDLKAKKKISVTTQPHGRYMEYMGNSMKMAILPRTK